VLLCVFAVRAVAVRADAGAARRCAGPVPRHRGHPCVLQM